MGFKVRGYTRDIPQEKVRDYSLFAIVTEGTEREPDYFRLFDGIDRIKVDIIEPEVSDEENAQEKRKASSPSKVLEKVKAYIAENQLSADDGDSLWCVGQTFQALVFRQPKMPSRHSTRLRRAATITSSTCP